MSDYHLHVVGLNEDELHTLFFSEGQRPLGDLDLHTTREVALAKVLSTLSERDKRRALEIQERFHVDPTGWNFPVDQVPHLPTVQQAVWQNRRLSLVYRQESGNIMTPLVHPLGLVVKAGIWYLIGATHETIRPFRIARIQQIEVLQETFNRPEEFHLAEYWTAWCARFLPSYPVKLLISEDAIPRLLQLFGEALRDHLLRSEPDVSGWRTVSVVFETMETARAALLGFGPTAEVVEPRELRVSVMEWAEGLLTRYTSKTRDQNDLFPPMRPSRARKE
ncbi:transcriptional regulator [Reticulibacter mediterranei]|uniref:Transcriptional regulator n=1 Tax=Reticulibacter mediterranei TaxID=2778369 RepID=A0A8J3N6K2_9CHLR|nr:transcriptional regulator [Reticulibacter mediterranei]